MSEYPVEAFLTIYRNDLERQIDAAETELAFWSNQNAYYSAKTPEGLAIIRAMNSIRQGLSDKRDAIVKTRELIDGIDCYGDHIEFHSQQLLDRMDEEENAG